MATILNLPELRPAVLLDFANSGHVDPRITFTRASAATRWNAAGVQETVPADVPRIDYDPATGKCLGLLVEGARTNLRTNSRQPTASTGTVLGTSSAIAPDGLAVTSIEDDPATSGEHYVNDLAVAVTTGQTFVQSVFVKAMPGAERQVVLRVAGNVAGSQSLAFNVSDTACTATSAPSYPYGIQKYLNGWWRIWSRYTAVGDFAAAVFRVQVYKNNSGGYQGEAGKGLFLFGRQVEEGDSVTSYIPAGGSAATRAADSAVLLLSSPVSAGALAVAATPIGWSGTDARFVSLTDGTTANCVSLHLSPNGNGAIASVVTAAGNFQYGPAEGAILPLRRLSRALTWGQASARVATNGVLGTAGGAITLPAPMNRLDIGNRLNTQFFSGHIERCALYAARITDSQLQRITA